MGFRFRLEFHVHIHRDKEIPADDKKAMMDMRPEDFCNLAELDVERRKSLTSRSTVDNYLTALRSFRCFILEENIDSQICADLFKHYERWLHDKRLKPNTSSCYMRSLRTLMADIYGEETKLLFADVYTGSSITDKRSLPLDEIAKLQAVVLKPNSFLALVRDLFLFSFYALGMPFVDMAFLRKDQIASDQITYYRHKTGQPISIKIEPCIQKIISRYQNRKSCYLFPLLKSDEPKAAYQEYLLMLNRYNRSLKDLAKKAGIQGNLTSYVARHSWASAAYRNNVEIPVISKALGHANPRNTMIYIRQLEDERLFEANHRLLKEISKKK